MHLPEDIRYVGVNDHDIDLFEGLYPVPEGVSYNSYVILDEKTGRRRLFFIDCLCCCAEAVQHLPCCRQRAHGAEQALTAAGAQKSAASPFPASLLHSSGRT